MNPLIRFVLHRKWKQFCKQHPKEAEMVWFAITRIFWLAAFILKNVGLIVGIAEQLVKVAIGIIHLTPTRKDDGWIEGIKAGANNIQGWLYNGAETIVNFYKALGNWSGPAGGRPGVSS